MPWPQKNDWYEDSRTRLSQLWQETCEYEGHWQRAGDWPDLASVLLVMRIWKGERKRGSRSVSTPMRFLLINQLLAKAVNPQISARALKTTEHGCTLPGAWSARGHCDRVLLPFNLDVLSANGPSPLGHGAHPFTSKQLRETQLSVERTSRTKSEQTWRNVCELFERVDANASLAEPLLRMVVSMCFRELKVEQSAKPEKALPALQRRRAFRNAVTMFLRSSSRGERPQAVAYALAHTLGRLQLVGWTAVRRRHVHAADTIAGVLHQLGDVNGFAGKRLVIAWEAKDYRLRLTHLKEKLALCRQHAVSDCTLVFLSRGIEEEDRKAIDRLVRVGDPKLRLEIRVEPDIPSWISRHIDLLSGLGIEKLRVELQRTLNDYGSKEDREAWARAWSASTDEC